MSKLIIFDIWADYAHFKKPYTTVSPLTYAIPSRTSITGIIGAILGISKNQNNTMLNISKCNIAIKIVEPIKKTIINHNLIDTKKAKYFSRIKQRTQIRFEYLKDVKYRIYIEIFDKDMYSKLKSYLENHRSFYTVSLGLSENLCNFKYQGEYGYIVKTGDIEIDSVINLKNLSNQNIDFNSEGKEYFTDNFAIEMKEDREVIEYSNVLYERTGKRINLKNCEYISIKNKENENIRWL